MDGQKAADMNQPTNHLTNQPPNPPTSQPSNLPLFPDSAHIDPDGHLHLAGLDAPSLAKEFGTPLYVYDEATIRARCRAYRDALAAHYPAPGEIAYAAKAFLCTAMAQLVAAEDMGLDVVSGGELYVALQAGFPAARIHFHGNNKSPAELASALDVGVGRIVADSFYELETLARLAAERDAVARVWLRISPNVDAHTHAYRKTGLLDSKFGFPLATGDAARAAQQALCSPHLALTGLHVHIGSQIFERAPFLQAVEALLDFAAEMKPDGFELRELSPGGGLGVRYVESDPPAPIEPYVQALSQAVAQGCQARGLPLPRLILEPGRSIVAQAGVALYTVGARKEIPGLRTYVSVDGGMADNPRPALYGARYTAILADKADQPLTETITVAGKFCESGDVLIRDVRLPRAEPGDLLAVPASGAYNLAMSSNYNQAPRPAAVLVRDGEARLILRRETYDDLTRRDLPLPAMKHAARSSRPFTIVGLGELLWDLLPGGKQLGGAPANFAYQAAALGDRGIVASCVGTDPLGDEVCTRLAALNLTTRYIQRDPSRPTGTVHVQVDAEGQPEFTITDDVAWDALAWTPEWEALAAEADAVCFGSLAQRGATAHETIQRFLRATRPDAVCLFDVNLRQNYFSPGVLDVSLRRATMAKLNDAELPRVARLLGLTIEEDEEDETIARRLLRAYDLALVCVTRGAHGSLLVTERETAVHPGYSVKVIDTVGSGDAFAAAVAHHWLRRASLATVNDAANRLGAYVATKPGATPALPPDVRRQVLQPQAHDPTPTDL
jgi:diaminopimelate decarboxylase